MQEAISKVIVFGFDDLGLKAIEANTHLENENSTKFLKKYNFTKQEDINYNRENRVALYTTIILN